VNVAPSKFEGKIDRISAETCAFCCKKNGGKCFKQKSKIIIINARQFTYARTHALHLPIPKSVGVRSASLFIYYLFNPW
jgi:hypothetical protein